MGRPLNSRFFGATGDNTQATIPIRFQSGGAVIEGYILSQRGVNKFNCSKDDGSVTEVCRLTDDGSVPNANGEAQIIGIAGDGNAVAVKKLTAHKAVDFDNNAYTWEVEDDSTESLLRLTAV